MGIRSALVLAMLFVAAACGSDDGAESDDDSAAPTSANEEAVGTTASSPPEGVLITGLHDARYCEILAVTVDESGAVADVWNTIELNDCPQDAWEALDSDQVRDDLGASAAIKNGPRHWVLDEIQGDGGGVARPEVVDLDGVEMRMAATVDVTEQLESGRSPYFDTSVVRDTVFVFDAGTEVYRLADPDGSIYYMQSYSLEVDAALTVDQLAGLGDRLDLPNGWSFESEILDAPVEVEAIEGLATVVQDELQNTYQLSSTTTQEAAVDCIEEVTRQPGGPDGPTLRIRAVTDAGCAPLDESLIALNWYSFDDREVYGAYAAAMADILPAHGHGVLFNGATAEMLETPEGVPASGGSYTHEEFALAYYSSAGGFLDMLISPEFQAAQASQRAGARSADYVWALQRCIYGCPDEPTMSNPEGPHIAMLFEYEGDDLIAAVETLATDLATGEVAYAGEVAGILEIVNDGVALNPQNPPWGRGAVLFSLESVDDVDDLLADSALVAFRPDTSQDVLALVDGGAFS